MMLYETAARSSEVLALDIQDLDRRNRRSKVTRKGAAVASLPIYTRVSPDALGRWQAQPPAADSAQLRDRLRSYVARFCRIPAVPLGEALTTGRAENVTGLPRGGRRGEAGCRAAG